MLHVLTGDLDSDSEGSLLLAHHPEGKERDSAHWTATLDSWPDSLAPTALHTEHVHTFEGLTRVEGIASDSGTILYVSDEDETVRTRFFGDQQMH